MANCIIPAIMTPQKTQIKSRIIDLKLVLLTNVRPSSGAENGDSGGSPELLCAAREATQK